MKGYTNRIKRGVSSTNNIYSDDSLLKKIDIFEVGTGTSWSMNSGLTKVGLKVASGTDFSARNYLKLKYLVNHNIPLNSSYNLNLYGKGGVVLGKNAPLQ